MQGWSCQEISIVIKLAQGDLLEQDDVDAIVNTVNCVGVMGKGIALQFKNKWPANFAAYAAACKAGEVRPDRMFVFDTGALAKPNFIINFPTKDHWRGASRIEYIRDGLVDLVAQVRRLGIRSIALPPLGCGNGGLDWSDVRPLIERAFEALPDVDVRLFEPAGAPDPKSMEVRTKRPRMTAGRAAIVKVLDTYRELNYGLSKIEVQKLAYFLQEAGGPLDLRFVKHHYARVGRLIEGYQSSYGMELLASVHWVATREPGVRSIEDAVTAVHAWNDRKRELMRPEHIGAAWRRLEDEGWLGAAQ